jgi:hypothetical protein
MGAVFCFALATLTGLTSCLLTAGVSRAADDFPTDKAVLPSTLAFIKVDNAARLRASLSATQVGQLVADRALRPMLDDILTKLDKGRDEQRAAIGTTLLELLLLPEGPMSIALLGPGGTVNTTLPVTFLISADAGNKSKQFEEALTKCERQNYMHREPQKGEKLHRINQSTVAPFCRCN